jgi:long-chain acyl-CoA synthetase
MTTFIQLFESSFREHFDLPALDDYAANNTLTYGQLAAQIARLHLLFDACNVQAGDRIALVGKNNVRWCVAHLATITYGAVIVPILQDFSAADICHIIRHSQSKLLFCSESIWKTLDPETRSHLDAAFSLSSGDLLPCHPHQEHPAPDLDAIFRQKYPDGFTLDHVALPPVPDNRLMVLNYTSGTTGFSKGVMITGANLKGNMDFAHQEINLQAGNRMLSFLPLAHTYGAAFDYQYALTEGCHITLLGKTPAPKVLVQAFADVRPALIIAVPLILEKIYRKMILPLINKKSMRIALRIPLISNLIYAQIRKKLTQSLGGRFCQVIIGGAAFNSEVEAFLLKIKFPVSVGYGMTECAPLISFSLYPKFVLHSCGKVLGSMEARIDSPDPSSVAGEIQVRGVNVMQGYYRNEEATREVFTEDGWLKTGDLGTLDAGNNLFIRGRLKSMILGSSGQNIYPEEIEVKLDNLPFVLESLVVERDRKLVALVYPDYEALEAAAIPSADLPQLMESNRKTLNNKVASYEKIAEIRIHPTEFEKTPKKSIKRYLYQ